MNFITHLVLLSVFLAFTASGQPAPQLLTATEQELIETLAAQHSRAQGASRNASRYVVSEWASIKLLWHRSNFDQLARDLRQEAKDRDPALKAALEDFLAKNRAPIRLALPTNSPAHIELLPDATARQLFPKDQPGALSKGWKRFYQLYPNSGGFIQVSRAGLDPEGTIAVLFFGQYSSKFSGGGGLYVLRRKGAQWALTRERLGSLWVVSPEALGR